MRRLTRRQRIAATVLAVLALAFITLDLGGSSLSSAHSGVRGTLGALYRGTDALMGPVRRYVQGLPSAGTNQARVAALRNQNAALRAQLVQAQADRATRAELDRLQLAAAGSGRRILPARVVALGPGQGFDWTVTLDVGRSSGVGVGQTVTDGGGLVGRVLHADRDTSVVLLATDPGSGVGVRDTRSGQVGIATGTGSGGFTFVPMDPQAVVRVGDALATGPVGSTSFVPGLAVGTVTAVRASADGTVRATVRPTASPSTLDLVGVMLTGAATDATGATRAALEPGAGR